MHVCDNVVKEILQRYNDIKANNAQSDTSKTYLIKSAKAVNLMDTKYGIQFSSRGKGREIK